MEEKRTKKTRSLVLVDPSVGFCFLRALALCVFYKENYFSEQRGKWFKTKHDNCKQLQLVDILVDRYGIEKKEVVDLDDLTVIQRMIHEYKLVVVDKYSWRNIIFRGNGEGKNLYIEFDPCGSSIGHYNAIFNMKAFTGLRYFCEKCHTGSNERFKHMCKGSCKYCFAPGECQIDAIRTLCNGCNIIYPTNSCYQRPKEKKLCGYMRRCEKCDQEWKTRFEHNCNAQRCNKCHLIVTGNHSCFIKPLDLEKLIEEDQSTRVMIFSTLKAIRNHNKPPRNMISSMLRCCGSLRLFVITVYHLKLVTKLKTPVNSVVMD